MIASPLVMPEVITGLSLLLLFVSLQDFIGWPTSTNFGGFHIESKTLWLDDGGEYNEELLVSKLDVHPGKKGHEKIAEFLYDWLG